MRLAVANEEWWPVLELQDPEHSAYGDVEVPDDLAERYRQSLAAFVAVQNEILTLIGEKTPPSWTYGWPTPTGSI